MKNKMHFEEWINYLISQHPVEIDMGLSRVREVAKRLNLLNLGETKIITVAGTNGKGTTCAFLENIFLNANYQVGVYSSPHLLKFNERVRINNRNATDDQLIEAFKQIELAREEITLTFFEYSTLSALYVFKQQAVDIVLLEVGLGGRLDATNMIDANIAVLTSIGLDHQEYLGNTRESVGIEKVGVCRKERPAIIGEPEVPHAVKQRLKEIGANTYFVGDDFNSFDESNHWSFNGLRVINNIPAPQLPLQNAVTAIQTALMFDPTLTDEMIKSGVEQASLPGRMELVSQQPKVYLDVAHNPQSAQYLKRQLNKFEGKRVFALCGMLKDKDIQSVIQCLQTEFYEWNLVSLDVSRGAESSELAECFDSQQNINCFGDLNEAWANLKLKITDDDVVIVFGSFYTVAGFKKLKQG
ncbi:bifunctional tetrahydrofolate synthase/dihydrofolate synthase [Shewanella sp. 202IG2-18]|uniref:bifunctional tetrahydrofolate synthase/dihydrofolate synthase n=1 Tax=Parashewanella hymeniacidonis TaxID=2807618 RepID=UPI001961FEDC|nr:bifunctional tetrahydrofolate synthase/dihydrofolate synthase [Parashewanella hymeniacidonis]MBM7074159.1 bifunctional tetrahydrofolate synthase/dihydrofolate synthase [Parashewanella hymeniacidonis]